MVIKYKDKVKKTLCKAQSAVDKNRLSEAKQKLLDALAMIEEIEKHS